MTGSLVAGRVETAYCHPDWDAAAVSPMVGLAAFTSADDPHWTGIVALAPGQALRIAEQCRNDIYVLRGSVQEVASCVVFEHETFLRRNVHSEMLAGVGGATLLVYRDHTNSTDVAMSLQSEGRVWSDGCVPGMRVSVLSDAADRLLLVSWKPGTEVPSHAHPAGEDILVISGALSDTRGRHPAGSWMRFHPGSGHAPFATVETVIVLRNGHLSDARGPARK